MHKNEHVKWNTNLSKKKNSAAQYRGDKKGAHISRRVHITQASSTPTNKDDINTIIITC